MEEEVHQSNPNSPKNKKEEEKVELDGYNSSSESFCSNESLG